MHLGDVAPFRSMTPITAEVLFSPAPSPELLGTYSADLGSAAWPTWRAGVSNARGTVLGPDGANVPSFSQNAAASLAGLGEWWDDGVASSPDDAINTGRSAGPITFLSAMPTMVLPAGAQVPVEPDFFCKLGNWATANPGLAVLSTLGVFLVLKGKKGKR